MIPVKSAEIIILFFAVIFILSCKPVILPGDIKGVVTDAETTEPVPDAKVKIIQSYDSTTTGIDGAYLLENIPPGGYEIQASKFTYNNSSKDIEVVETEVKEVNFTLNGIPIRGFSDTVLNFELDLTSLLFTISNRGKGTLLYQLKASQNWISVYPSSGEVSIESDTILVTINKSGLSDITVYKETIKVVSDNGTDTIDVILNGFEYYGQVYKIVKIGTQTWMAENLNAGKKLSYLQTDMRNNGILEKNCFINQDSYCTIYGAIYEWGEAMQYETSDDGITGTTKGICPDGWHLPTQKEWLALGNNLGGMTLAGGKMKESGFSHWLSPNTDATNESGFTALPGGYVDFGGPIYETGIGSVAGFWTATLPPDAVPDQWGKYDGYHLKLSYDNSRLEMAYETMMEFNVRCIKDE